MKVIDVTEFFSESGGGVRTHLEAKGRALRARGHVQLVIAPGPTGERDDESVVRIGGPSLPYDPSYYLMARLDRILAIVRREKPDVLEVHSPYLALLASRLVGRSSFGVRTFFWHADFIDTYLQPKLKHRLPPPAFGFVRAASWNLVRTATAACDSVFVAGRKQFEKLQSLEFRNLSWVPFGVDKTVFGQQAGNSTTRRALLGDRNDRSVCLIAAGRFVASKRFDLVVDAVRALRPESNVVLALYGDGPDRAALEKRAAGLPVRFLGFEPDRRKMASALASADIMVHGCPHETFGLTVAEARACGLPVVVPDEGGAAENFDPSCSEMYRAGDAQACAAAIERLIARGLPEMKARAQAAAPSVRGVDDHFDEVISVYERLLSRRRVAAAPE